MKYKRIGRISSEAVENATGKSWDEWIKIIDKDGGKNKDHKEIVAFLDKNYKLSGWWQQSVTVGYEYALGKRIVGETADVGFQLGAQKTVPLSQKETWKKLTSSDGIKKWLGDIELNFKKRETYKTKNGTSGEIRVVKPKEKIRMTWQPNDWKEASTLQIYLFCPRNTKDKTTVRFHHEKLPNKKDKG